MDKNRKIEKFFKKRINDFDTPVEDWEKPGLTVFQNAQNHFPKHPKKDKKDRRIIFIIFTGLMLAMLFGYVYHITQKTKILESKLKVAQLNLQQKDKELLETKKQQKEKIKTQKENAIKSQTINTKTDTQRINAKTKFQTVNAKTKTKRTEKTPSSSNTIKVYSLEGQEGGNSLKNGYQERSTTSANAKEEQPIEVLRIGKEDIQNVNQGRLELIAVKKIQLLKYKNEYPQFIPKLNLIKPLKQNKKRFEVGLYVASLNYEIPVYYETTKLEIEDEKVKNYSIKIPAKRLHVAYALKPNLWVTSGIRNGGFDFNKDFSSKLIYDKSEEYIDEEGKTKNDFDINTQTDYSLSKNGISLEVPEGTDIPNGDLLEVSWNHIQELQFIQVPLGVEYYLGQKKLKWLLKSGLAWNKVVVNDYFFDIKINYNNESLTIKEIEDKISLEKIDNFVSSYVGFGVNYEINKQWHLRASLLAEQNFRKSKSFKDDKFKSNHLNHILEIGLNYRW